MLENHRRISATELENKYDETYENSKALKRFWSMYFNENYFDFHSL